MAQNYTNEMRFALFPNDKGGNDKRPDFRGNCSIDGIEYKLSGWMRTTKDGKNREFISGSIEKAEPKQSAAPASDPSRFPRATPTADRSDTMTIMKPEAVQDGDVPF